MNLHSLISENSRDLLEEYNFSHMGVFPPAPEFFHMMAHQKIYLGVNIFSPRFWIFLPEGFSSNLRYQIIYNGTKEDHDFGYVI